MLDPTPPETVENGIKVLVKLVRYRWVRLVSAQAGEVGRRPGPDGPICLLDGLSGVDILPQGL